MRALKSFFFLLLASTVMFASCRKNLRDSDTDTVASEEHNWVRGQVFQVLGQIHDQFSNQTDLTAIVGDTLALELCPDANLWLTSANGGFPLKLYIDFGAGVTCTDGNVRSGLLSGTVSKNYQEIFAKTTLSLDDFEVDGRAFDGYFTWQNKVIKTDTFLLDLAISEMGVAGDTVDMNWGVNYRMQWISGSNTMEVTGGAEGRASTGALFETDISENLIWDTDCTWIVQGVEQVTPNNSAPRANDYGDGACDNAYEIAIASKQFSKTL